MFLVNLFKPRFNRLSKLCTRSIVMTGHRNELDLDYLMQEPKNIRKLEDDPKDISQIFSVSEFNENKRNFKKDLYEVRTVDGNQIDKKEYHTPSTSFIQMYFPFSKSADLVSNYVAVDESKIRFGLIFNEMDALATDVAYKYVRGTKASTSDDFRILTAAVDRMDFFQKIHADQDFKMNGYVMYVSKSSMVIGIDLFTKEKSGEWKFLGNASYILVARDMEGKAYKVPQLSFSGEQDLIKCKSRFEYGYHVQRCSKESINDSEYQASPTDEESNEIHDLLFTLHHQRQFEQDERRAFVPMEKTANTSYILVQPQRNVYHGVVAGGFILQEAFELSWLTGHLFCEREPFEFVGLDSLHYMKSSAIGSGHELKSKVTYTDDTYFRINATVNNIVESQKSQSTNFNFTFKFPDGMGERKKIMPGTYHDALTYLMNKRMLSKFLF